MSKQSDSAVSADNSSEAAGTKCSDAYDEQIARLTANPIEISSEWQMGVGLFKMLPSTKGPYHQNCLTMIASARWPGPNPQIDAEIRADKRIPHNGHDIVVADLPVFAEWQRRIDRELGGQP